MNLGVLDESSLCGRYLRTFKNVAEFSCNTVSFQLFQNQQLLQDG